MTIEKISFMNTFIQTLSAQKKKLFKKLIKVKLIHNILQRTSSDTKLNLKVTDDL